MSRSRNSASSSISKSGLGAKSLRKLEALRSKDQPRHYTVDVSVDKRGRSRFVKVSDTNLSHLRPSSQKHATSTPSSPIRQDRVQGIGANFSFPDQGISDYELNTLRRVSIVARHHRNLPTYLHASPTMTYSDHGLSNVLNV